jgi:hypothetical protein
MVADLLARLRELGAELVLIDGGKHAHIRPGTMPVPNALVEELRGHKDGLRTAVIVERFGPLTPGGKMCYRCHTLDRCRILRAGFICDSCRRDDDVPYPEVLPLVEAGGLVAAMVANAMLLGETT